MSRTSAIEGAERLVDFMERLRLACSNGAVSRICDGRLHRIRRPTWYELQQLQAYEWLKQQGARGDLLFNTFLEVFGDIPAGTDNRTLSRRLRRLRLGKGQVRLYSRNKVACFDKPEEYRAVFEE